ncbi:protein of unknown function [Candidatus Methylocalor cossyra]|uniref:Uncharacterized protein n=1 Tax=Candidatus Methylocalor cossyra TaxID=3108543 RepID=A0ABP1CBF6_9GAMM
MCRVRPVVTVGIFLAHPAADFPGKISGRWNGEPSCLPNRWTRNARPFCRSCSPTSLAAPACMKP